MSSELSYQPPAASRQQNNLEPENLKARSWQLEAWSPNLIAGSWKLEAGS
jgi:hypothetical protein